MKKLLICLAAVLITTSTMAEHHKSAEADVYAAVKAFNAAYASNDVEGYFDNYTDDATLYFYGARQIVADYHEEWTAMVDAGGAVEKNDISDVQVQVMPGDEVAVATYFVANATRSPDGETAVARAFESDVWQKIEDEWKIVSLHYTEIAPEE
jgi:ketosteroid isomerase-like protein